MLHFHADSYPMTVKRISCDKEIGSPKAGWHTCNRAAAFVKESRTGQFLHYCKGHAPANAEPVKA